MALDISISGSASRLQAQRDYASQNNKKLLQDEAAARARELERQAAELRQAEAQKAAFNTERILAERDKNARDRQQLQDQLTKDTLDGRALQRDAIATSDLRQFLVDEQQAQAVNDRLNAAPLTPTAPNDRTTPAPADDSLRTTIAERNARLAARAADDQAFATQQAQDYQRSQRTIDQLRIDPTAAPVEPSRGSIVDFQA